MACDGDVGYAVSPANMKCVSFKSTCDIPEGWIKLTSCDLTKVIEDKKIGKIENPDKRNDRIMNGNGSENLKMFSQILNGDFSKFTSDQKKPEESGMSFFRNDRDSREKNAPKAESQKEKENSESFFFSDRNSQ